MLIAQAAGVLSSDEDLIQRCLANDQTAWAILVAKYTRLVYSVPVKYRLAPEDAADVFQAVWTDLYRNLGGIQRVAGIRAWLITTAVRRSLLRIREQKEMLRLNSAGLEVADKAVNPVDVGNEAEREQKLREAIKQLPERCQILVQMLFFEQPPRPYAEIARELGLAEGSVGFIRGRCLHKLRDLLRQQGIST